MGEKVITRGGHDFVFDGADPEDYVNGKIDEWMKTNGVKNDPVPTTVSPANKIIPSVARKTNIPVEDRMRAVAQGLGGVSDEALAFGRSLFGDEDYGDALKDERTRFKDAEDEHYWSTLAGQGALGLGTGYAGTKALQNRPGVGKSRASRGLAAFAKANPWKTGAAVGATTALPSGFASGEGGLPARAQSAAIAAPFGALTGMGGVALPKALKVGYDKLFPMLAGSDSWAANKIAGLLKDAPGMSPDRVEGRVARDAALGVPSMPLNTTPALRDAAEELVTRGGAAGKAVEDALARQQKGQRGRIKDDVEWLIAPDKYHDSLGQLRGDLKANAQTDFAKAYSAKPLVNPELDEMVLHPFGQIGLDHAKQLAANELPPRTLNFQSPVRDSSGKVTSPGQYGTKELHDMRMAIDDVLFGKSGGELADRFRNPMTGDLTKEGQQLYAYRKALDTKIGALNPDYRVAVDRYADQASIIKAQQQGRSAGLNPSQLDQHTWEETIKDLRNSPAEFSAFRQGAAQSLFDKYTATLAKPETANWGSFIKNPGVTDRLRPLFDDHRSWLLFKSILQREDELYKQHSRITAGSPSARRLAQLGDGLDSGAGMVERGISAAGGSPLGIVRLMHGALNLIPTSTPDQRRSLARMLTSNDPAEVRRAMDAVHSYTERLTRSDANAGFNNMGVAGGLGIQMGDERPERGR